MRNARCPTPEQVGAWGGLAPLHHAVRQGHVEAALTLLEAGADIDQTIADGSTPLLMASLNGQWDLASILVERGADPNDREPRRGPPRCTPSSNASGSLDAAYSHPTEHQRQETNYLQMMERLLDAGADPDARLNRHLWYMEYTFNLLVRSGVNVKGATPFWRAAFALDLAAMRLLDGLRGGSRYPYDEASPNAPIGTRKRSPSRSRRRVKRTRRVRTSLATSLPKRRRMRTNPVCLRFQSDGPAHPRGSCGIRRGLWSVGPLVMHIATSQTAGCPP